MPKANTKNPTKLTRKGQNSIDVGTTIKVPRETFELLRDVAIFRHLKDVATEASARKNKALFMVSISEVITDLVEKNRAALEIELDKKSKK